MNRISSANASFDRGPRTLIAGLGNVLFGDDGVGVHAVRHFQSSAPRTCLAVEVGTEILDAVPLFGNFGRILAFGALRAGGCPGSVYALRAEDIVDQGKHDSLHDTQLVQRMRIIAQLPADVAIVAAEPERIDWGIELSPAVSAAVPVMVREALRIIAEWRFMDAQRNPGLHRPLTSRARILQELRLVD